MIVALDTMIFIYLFELRSQYLPQIQLLFDRIERKELQAVTSFISPLEVFSSPAFEAVPDKLMLYTRFFQKTPNLTVVPFDWEVALQAAELRRKYKPLKTPDAVQIATAIVAQADMFITNDDRLTHLTLPLKIALLGTYQ